MTRYLLDVSSLIALGLVRHEFHERMVQWMRTQRGSVFLTCSVSELGFVRIASQRSAFRFSVEEAKALLHKLKRTPTFTFEFIADANDISCLPHWVSESRQTTDGHLLALAGSNQAILATFDSKIPGAHLIR